MTQTQKIGVPACLKDYLMVDTRSMEYAHDVAARSFVPHKLAPTGAKSDFHFVHSHASLQNISLCYTSYGNELVVKPESMDDFYLIQLPVHGAVDIESGRNGARVERALGSVISPMNRSKFHWSENSGIMSIKIDRQALEDQLRRLIQRDVDNSIEFQLALPFADPEYRSWYIEVLRMMQYFQCSKMPEAELVSLEGWFEQKLMEILLLTHPNNYSHLLSDTCYQAPSKAVGEAIDYMHEHLVEKISLGKLASVTGVTGRTLHNGFKRFKNVSPLEYLTEVRLQAARTQLLKRQEGASVTDIAQASGFSHLGRFSRRYFEEFGERPSETFRRSSAKS